MILTIQVWVEQFDIARRNVFPVKEVSVDEFDPNWGDDFVFEWRQKANKEVGNNKEMIVVNPIVYATDEEHEELGKRGFFIPGIIPGGLNVENIRMLMK